jgi:hypothetical protein
VAVLVGAVRAEEKRGRLPDNRTIDTFEYSVAPELFGSATRLVITRKGKVAYSYQSAPHTNSGGEVVTKSWEIPAREAVALLEGLVADGLLELEDAVGDKFPKHFFEVTYGRWRLSAGPREMPEKVMKRLLPLLRKAHPAQWNDRRGKSGAS